MPHGQWHGLARHDVRGQIVQHAVAHVDGVGQPQAHARRAVDVREVLEHPLARDAGIRVLARRRQRRLFWRAGPVHRHEGVDAGGGEHHEARTREALRHQRRHMRVHRPGQPLAALAAELAAGHEDDVGHLGQGVQGLRRQQVSLQALDALGLQPGLEPRLGKARHADHTLVRRGALGHARQRGAHLAAHAQHQDVAVQPGQVAYQRGRGPRHHLFQVGLVLEGARQALGCRCFAHASLAAFFTRVSRAISGDFL